MRRSLFVLFLCSDCFFFVRQRGWDGIGFLGSRCLMLGEVFRMVILGSGDALPGGAGLGRVCVCVCVCGCLGVVGWGIVFQGEYEITISMVSVFEAVCVLECWM